MKYFIVIAVFLVGISSSYAQKHATCDDAIPIKTASFGPVTPAGWADSSLCEKGNENMYFGKSHKVVWFSFIAPSDTVLTFQIVPENATDDFDFMLFKADRGDFCQKEKQRKVKPIRTNFAKPTAYSKGATGLSLKGTEAFIAPGYNSPNSSAVQVKKGEWYYLVVDNYVSNKGGFMLNIPILSATAPVTTDNKSYIDAMPIKAPPITPPTAIPATHPNFYIHVLDSANHPIKALLILDGIQEGASIKADTDIFSVTLKKYQTVKIRANAAGHMPYQSSYSTTGDTSSATFWVRLQPIRAAEKITLKDIYFQGDSPNILPESLPALDYLLTFVVNNPNVNILIKGYTNDPDHSASEQYDQRLSEKRAKAVMNYLVENGIDKKRMKCIGYGNSKLLYPRPINEDQKAANRRVEIEIQ